MNLPQLCLAGELERLLRMCSCELMKGVDLYDLIDAQMLGR
jgi:hypothetical protein